MSTLRTYAQLLVPFNHDFLYLARMCIFLNLIQSGCLFVEGQFLQFCNGRLVLVLGEFPPGCLWVVPLVIFDLLHVFKALLCSNNRIAPDLLSSQIHQINFVFVLVELLLQMLKVFAFYVFEVLSTWLDNRVKNSNFILQAFNLQNQLVSNLSCCVQLSLH